MCQEYEATLLRYSLNISWAFEGISTDFTYFFSEKMPSRRANFSNIDVTVTFTRSSFCQLLKKQIHFINRLLLKDHDTCFTLTVFQHGIDRLVLSPRATTQSTDSAVS